MVLPTVANRWPEFQWFSKSAYWHSWCYLDRGSKWVGETLEVTLRLVALQGFLAKARVGKEQAKLVFLTTHLSILIWFIAAHLYKNIGDIDDTNIDVILCNLISAMAPYY